MKIETTNDGGCHRKYDSKGKAFFLMNLTIMYDLLYQARNKKRHVDLSSDKSVYILDPFDELGFIPEIHNKYVRIRFCTIELGRIVCINVDIVKKNHVTYPSHF